MKTFNLTETSSKALGTMCWQVAKRRPKGKASHVISGSNQIDNDPRRIQERLYSAQFPDSYFAVSSCP